MLWLLSSYSAYAQQSITQAGSWSCPATGGIANALKEEDCPQIAFPVPFGTSPQVFVAIASGGIIGGFSITATNITPQGFIPHWRGGGSGSNSMSGLWVAVGPSLVLGQVRPKYMVLTVIYAPPGTNGGKSSSSVTYANGSTTGTTTSSSNTFKAGVGVDLDASGGFFGNGGGVNLGFDYSGSQTDSSSYDVKKSTTTTISRTGPGQDGVNHDEDQIYLWLNPTVDVSIAPASIAWHFDSTQAEIQSLYVGDLKRPSQMAPGVKAALAKYGIVETDFPDILKRDPFSDPGYQPDPNRFLPIGFNFPYAPPYSANDPVTTLKYDLNTTSVSSSSHDATDDYKVSLAITTQAGFGPFFTLKVKDSASWEWTNKTSFSSSVGRTESASATIGGPAYGYTGPTQVQVLYDSVYRSFAFQMIGIGTQPSLRGTLKDSKGASVANKMVRISVGGVLIRTVTDSNGNYAFYDPRIGSSTVEAEP